MAHSPAIARFTIIGIAVAALSATIPVPSMAQHSVAREWNERLLAAIRVDFARPTVHARNLFHTSMAMYDAWAAYDVTASPFLLGKTVGGFECPFEPIQVPQDAQAHQEEAMAYAAYRLLKYRFAFSPGASTSIPPMDSLFVAQGYDSTFTSTDYVSDGPAALGNYIAQCVIDFGLQDGSNESGEYVNLFYIPANPPLLPELPGNPEIEDRDRWQPLGFEIFIDQAGNEIPGEVPHFLSPEWGIVVPFCLSMDDLTIYNRDNFDYWVYHDPGAPPLLEPEGPLRYEYQWGQSLVAIWSGHLDPSDNVMWDISPGSIGNIQSLPTTVEELRDFYDVLDGGDPGTGHPLNPHTGQPYDPQLVPRGDYTRVLAEFWADGPDSETPPGHWYVIANYVSDHPELEKRFGGQGPILDDLEWDVKLYFMLGGAMHDAAITAWGIKGWYDYIRPISAIRAMADLGQSSDSLLVNYHPRGILLEPGHIELVQLGDSLSIGDSLAVADSTIVDKIKLWAWRGPTTIQDPETDVAGVGWILAENWWPYQRPTFITPPFAGYVSGHSTYSRAAALILESMTGDVFFPGGMAEFECPQNEFLVFEDGPSVDLTLQWATYRDASDQTSLSRIWGGIHPPVDDIPGRLIGEEIGADAFDCAEFYFDGGVVSTSDAGSSPAAMAASSAPNPFNPRTVIRYTVPVEADVEVAIVDVQGRVVAVLVTGRKQPGLHRTSWDGRGEGGDLLASGTYFYRLSAQATATGERVVETGKMTLVK